MPAPPPILLPDGLDPICLEGAEAASGPFEFARAPALAPHPPLFLSSGFDAPPAPFPFPPALIGFDGAY
jgi:hypothetical protein